MKTHRSRLALIGPVLALGLTSPAAAESLTTSDIFLDADLLSKSLMVGLVVATVAAVIVCALKILSGPRLAGGSAFISGLRAGGPLIGCLGGIYVAIMIFLGVSNVPAATMQMVAPGIAEALFIVALGLTSGVIAVIAHWIIEARIDRAALRP